MGTSTPLAATLKRALRTGLVLAALLATGFVGGVLFQPLGPVKVNGLNGSGVPSTAGADQRQSGGFPAKNGSSARHQGITGLIRTTDGVPIRHAILTLVNTIDHQSATATSDDTGYYAFEGVAQGVYRLSARKPGFVSLAYGQAGPHAQERPIVVNDTAPSREFNFHLPKGGTITGSVSDDEGEPVADAAVSLQPVEYIAGHPHAGAALAAATTDDRGMFRLTGVPEGPALVSVVAGGGFRRSPGGSPFGYVPTYHPSTAVAEEATPVSVKGGRTNTANVRLVPAPILTLSGVVASPSRRPDRAGFIRVARVASPGRFATVAPIAADGSFTVDVVALPGRYALTAVLGSGAPAGVDRHSEIARATIDVGTSSIRAITLAAVPGATLRGRVIVEGGSLRDVGAIRVFTQPVAADEGWPPATSVQVAPDGTFELRNLLWRGFLVTDLPVEGAWAVASVSAGGRDVSASGIAYVPGSVIDDARVVIRPRARAAR
jgi:hypothetical protein